MDSYEQAALPWHQAASRVHDSTVPAPLRFLLLLVPPTLAALPLVLHLDNDRPATRWQCLALLDVHRFRSIGGCTRRCRCRSDGVVRPAHRHSTQVGNRESLTEGLVGGGALSAPIPLRRDWGTHLLCGCSSGVLDQDSVDGILDGSDDRNLTELLRLAEDASQRSSRTRVVKSSPRSTPGGRGSRRG